MVEACFGLANQHRYSDFDSLFLRERERRKILIPGHMSPSSGLVLEQKKSFMFGRLE